MSFCGGLLRFASLFLSCLLRLGFSLFLLLDSLADLLGKLAVAVLAERFTLEVPYFFSKGFVTTAAYEACSVVVLSESAYTTIRNWFVAFVAEFTELLQIVRFAIRIPFFLVESGPSKWLLANKAHEVFWMPNFAEGRDGATYDWFTAVTADALEEFEVVGVAVEMSFILMAISSLEFAIALLAPEVLRMHSLPMQCDVLANDRSLTLATNTSGRFNKHGLRGLARYAKRLTFMLFVGLATQFDIATEAVEVIWMIGPAYGVDARICDGLCTVRALGSEEFIVVILTIWLALVL